MKISHRLKHLFHDEIKIKYQIFNSLFSHLPFENVKNVGQMLPLLTSLCEEGLQASKTPMEIMEVFFKKYAYLKNDKEQIEFLFALIQYIERQVVLFDSVEDAAFPLIAKHLSVGTIDGAYQFARQNGFDKIIKQDLKRDKVRIVYTAHPTQFYPNDVLRIISDLQIAVRKNEYTQIASLLRQLGKTPFINKKKPTPLDEARSIMYYLRYVNYEAIKKLHAKIVDYFLDDVNEFVPIVELGFWPGGDRDGNPFVTAETTLNVARELRYDILACYYQDMKQLASRLTFKGVKDLVVELKNNIYENLYGGKFDITEEKIVSQLQEIKSSLIKEHGGLFVDMVDTLLRQVKTFGLHFASIDIRQDSSKHSELMVAIAEKYLDKKKNYTELNEQERMQFLFSSNILLNENDFDDDIMKDTIANIKQIQSIQQRHGNKSIHRYIISNTTSYWQVLELYALFRFCGYQKDEAINVDFVPLFETIEGLNLASPIMEKLYTHDIYGKHLKRRNRQQTIMLGFSDGTKDGGYVKANWEIFINKEKLTSVSRHHQIDVVFF